MNVTVSWITTDLESGIARVQVSLDFGSWFEVSSGNSTVLSYLKNGYHNVTVRVTDGVGNHGDATVSFTVHLEEEKGRSSGLLTIGAAAIVIVALVVAALMMLRRRKQKRIPGPEKSKTSKP